MNHNATLLAYALGTLGPSAVRSLLPRSFALDGERIILSSPAAMIVWGQSAAVMPGGMVDMAVKMLRQYPVS